MEDYIEHGWVFLCAKLNVPATGLAETHPLTVRFPVSAPVYPMRLTEDAGTVPVDLYVIGKTWVKDPTGRMRTVITVDTASRPLAGTFESLGYFMEFLREQLEMNPDYLPLVPPGRDLLLDALMQNGGLFTHLQHEFKPGDDWGDITFAPSAAAVPGRSHYTLSGFIETVLLTNGFITALVVLVLALWVRSRTRPGERPHRAWALTILVLLGAWLFAGAWSLHRNGVIVDASRIVSGSRGGAGTGHGELVTWLKSLRPPP